MTDRINSIIVVLEHDMREDDVECVLNSIRMNRFVLSVKPNVTTGHDHVSHERLSHRYEMSLRSLTQALRMDPSGTLEALEKIGTPTP
jgi:hypothetical protein